MKVRVLPCPGVSHALCAHDKVTTALPSSLSAVSRSALCLRPAVWRTMGQRDTRPRPHMGMAMQCCHPGHERSDNEAIWGISQQQRVELSSYGGLAAVRPWHWGGSGWCWLLHCSSVSGGRQGSCLLPTSEKLRDNNRIFTLLSGK